MDDIIFKATTRGGRNFIEVTDTGTDIDRYMIKQDGAVDYANTTREVLAYLVKQSGWKEGTFDKIEIDTDRIGEQYLTILKMINKEFGFLYKFPKGSPERQYYFDIIRFIAQNIKNGTDMAIEDMIWKAKDALERKGIHSSRQIKSSQKGFENVAEGTQYDDYYIDTRGMGILDVENIIDAIEGRGNQAVLTVQSSDGSVQHTYFTSKSWKDYKDTKNAQGVAVTDVWITEVKGGSYVRNSRRPIKSERVTDGGMFTDVMFELINELRLKKDYRITRPSWDNFDFKHKSKDGGFTIYIDEKSQVIYGSVLGFGKHDNDVFKYETERVNVDSYNLKRECRKIIIDCMNYLNNTIGIISFEVTNSRRPCNSVRNSYRHIVSNNNSIEDMIKSYEMKISKMENMSNNEKLYEFGDLDTYNARLELYKKGLSLKKKQLNGEPYTPLDAMNISSARYIATDPETGEVLGSADTYEEAVNEWGEDVTITDSEVAEGQGEDMGLFQSRRPIKSEKAKFAVEVSDWSGNVIDDDYFDDEQEATAWANSHGKNTHACLWDNENETIIKEWEIESSRRPIKSGINDECIGTSKDGRYSIYKNDVDKVYMFAEDGRFTKEVDYDDDEVEGVLENWKEIYDIPLKSSKKPETTKQFVTRILSELETGEITEDEAAEEIAEANDVNIGYARQILSSYIADKDRYIASGMLELGEALNVEFDPDGNLDSWSVDFATDPEKPAPTLGGELVRAARYIISAFRDNDEKVGWGYAREVLNPAARFIVENTEYKQNDVFEDLLDGQTYDDDAYRQFIDMFETDFADYLRDHEELFRKLNKKSFEENTSESDEYSSIDEIIITDDERNGYLFKYDGDNYVCYGIDEGYSPEYSEGDVLTLEDYPYDNIDFNEEFGEFEQDGFIYSWEDGDGESIRISDVSLTNPMFDYDDVLNSEEVGNLIENGTEVYDINHNKLKISDIM